MDYNNPVRRITVLSDVMRLIRFAAILWLGYLVVLALITLSFPVLRSSSLVNLLQSTSLLYYLLLGYLAVFCLGLTYWTWIQRKLGRAFIPMMIAIITVVPVVITNFVGRLSPLGSRFAFPESSALAIFPFLFIGLLLVAWQYRWHYILLVIFGIAGLNMGIIWFSGPGSGAAPFFGVVVITLIQTVIFLAVGFSISYLMSRLVKQQQSLESANVRLTHYASTLEHLTISQERNRLARELHDTLAHTLSGLSVQLEAVKAYWDVDRDSARSVLEKSLAIAHSGLEETRRALKALRASPLEDLGLTRAIQTAAEDAAARGNLTLDLSIDEGLPAFAPDVEQGIYRIAQEAITNVVSHAQAKKMTVRLESAEGKLVLTIQDNGTGFEVEKINGSGRFGLIGIRERAQLLGGVITITSKPGSGTTVRLTLKSP